MIQEEITPIVEYKNILLKRDDFFICGNVNGGKLRQAIALIEKNLDLIKEKYNSTIVCPCSIKSPQSAIISEVCKKYNLRCLIVCYKTDKPNKNLSIAQDNDAILVGTNSGYTSVIEGNAKKQKGFFINMGFNAEEIINSNVSQVKNIPNNLNYLVVPVGSAMNFISILIGLTKYNKNPEKIIGVYVGKDPKPTLKKYAHLIKKEYTLIKSDYSYGKEINIDDYFFDPIYEAKAYDWIKKNIDVNNNRVLMWVIGKRNLTYKLTKIKWTKIY